MEPGAQSETCIGSDFAGNSQGEKLQVCEGPPQEGGQQDAGLDLSELREEQPKFESPTLSSVKGEGLSEFPKFSPVCWAPALGGR